MTVANGDEHVSSDLRGTRFTDWNNLYDAAFRKLRDLNAPAVLFPGGDSAYVGTDRGIEVHDLESWTPRRRITAPSPTRTWDGPRLLPSADGRLLVLIGPGPGPAYAARITTLQVR